MNIRKGIMVSVVAAIYVVLTIMLGEVGYGPIQFRIAEILNLFAFFHPVYIFGVGLGCAIANFYSFGLIDVVVGSLSTMAAMSLMWKFREHEVLASLLPGIFTFTIALEFKFLDIAPFWMSYASMLVSQTVICTIIGLPIYRTLKKNKGLVNILTFKSHQ